MSAISHRRRRSPQVLALSKDLGFTDKVSNFVCGIAYTCICYNVSEEQSRQSIQFQKERRAIATPPTKRTTC